MTNEEYKRFARMIECRLPNVPRNDREDIIQETLLILVRKGQKPTRTTATHTVVEAIRSYTRSRRLNPAIPAGESMSTISDPSTQYLLDTVDDEIDDAII